MSSSTSSTEERSPPRHSMELRAMNSSASSRLLKELTRDETSVLIHFGDQPLDIPADFVVPAELLVWASVYGLLGY